MRDTHKIIGGVRRIDDPVALAAQNTLDEQRKKSKREYVVEINLNSESLEKGTPRKPALPLSPKITSEAQPKIPQAYMDKLNKAIDDLHSFESQNARLAELAQSQQNRMEQLEQYIRQLQQQLQSNQQNNQNRALEEKQAQLQRYCSRIRLIEQKLETYELERQANMVLSNFYADLSGLFGLSDIPLEELRGRIHQAIRASSTTQATISSYQQRQHTQNQELNQLLKRLNEATFQKDSLELKLIDSREQIQEAVRQIQDLTKQFQRVQDQLRVTKDALGFVRQENEQIKRNSRVQQVKEVTITKENSSRMDSLQRQNSLLKKQTEELRKLINNYKESMNNAQIAHTNESNMLNSMLADLRKSYTEATRLKQTETLQMKSLRQALADAQRTIERLTASSQLRNSISKDNETLQRDNQQLRQQLDHLNQIFSKLQTDNSELHNTVNIEKRTVQQLREHINDLEEQLKNSQESEDLAGEFQRELAIKNSQYEFLQSQLQRARNSVATEQTKEKQKIFELENHIMEYQQENQRLSHEIDILRESSKRGDSVAQTAQQRESEFQTTIKKYSQQISNAYQKMSSLTEENHELQKQISSLRHQDEDQILQFQKEACDRQAMLTSIKEQLAQKQKHNQQLIDEIKKSSAQSAQLSKDLRAAQSQLDSTKRSQDSTQMSVERVRATFEGEIDRINTQVATLQVTLSSTKAQLAEAESKLVVQQKQMERSQSEKQVYIDDISSKQKIINQYDLELEQSRNSIRKLESEMSSMRVQVSTNLIDRESDKRQLSMQLDQLSHDLIESLALAQEQTKLQGELKAQIRQKLQRIDELQQFQRNSEHSQKLAEGELQHLTQLIEQIRNDAKQAEQRQKEWFERREKQLQQQLTKAHSEIDFLKGQAMRTSTVLSETQRKFAAVEETAESRLQRLKIQIQQEEQRTQQMRENYEQQIRNYSHRIKDQQKEKEQLEQKLRQVGLRCTNLTAVYHEMEEAALAYKDQCQTLRSQYQMQKAEHQQAISSFQQTSNKQIQLERDLNEARMKQGREIEHLRRQSDGQIRDLSERIVSLQANIEHLQQQLRKGRENINKLTDDLSKSQEQRRALQLQYSSRSFQKQQLQKCQQKLSKTAAELSKVKQQLHISTLQHEGRVTQLRQQVANYRNNQSQMTFNQERFRALKDDAYALQSEKVTLSTKLQMTEIRVEELQSENTHIRKQLSDLRTQRRISASSPINIESFTIPTYSPENTGTAPLKKSMELSFKPANSHNGQLKSRPSSAYHSSSDPNINVNYSQYYEQNLKQIKSGELRFSGQSVKKISAMTRKDQIKESTTALPNIPKSPKQFSRNSVDLIVSKSNELKFGGFNVNTVVSTQSLNNDAEDINFQRQ